jgi:hypothetical protein
MPTVNRPPLKKSSPARELASAKGLVYCGPTSTLVLIPIRDVTAAAKASV